RWAKSRMVDMSAPSTGDRGMASDCDRAYSSTSGPSRPGRRAPQNVDWAAVTTYLDHAATTPVRPEVADAYAQALQVGGNPSSLHAAGRAARRVLEEARESMGADRGAH